MRYFAQVCRPDKACGRGPLRKPFKKEGFKRSNWPAPKSGRRALDRVVERLEEPRRVIDIGDMSKERSVGRLSAWRGGLEIRQCRDESVERNNSNRASAAGGSAASLDRCGRAMGTCIRAQTQGGTHCRVDGNKQRYQDHDGRNDAAEHLLRDDATPRYRRSQGESGAISRPSFWSSTFSRIRWAACDACDEWFPGAPTPAYTESVVCQLVFGMLFSERSCP
jgi:hypothetical protein